MSFTVWRLLPQNRAWPRQSYLDEWREDSYRGPYVRNRDWVNANLYRVDTFRERRDGAYDVTLLSVEEPGNWTFEELCALFESTPYTLGNSYLLKDGVNCQGMTFYIVKWCRAQNVEYRLHYMPRHITIDVHQGDYWYTFSFAQEKEITIKDYEGG